MPRVLGGSLGVGRFLMSEVPLYNNYVPTQTLNPSTPTPRPKTQNRWTIDTMPAYLPKPQTLTPRPLSLQTPTRCVSTTCLGYGTEFGPDASLSSAKAHWVAFSLSPQGEYTIGRVRASTPKLQIPKRFGFLLLQHGVRARIPLKS